MIKKTISVFALSLLIFTACEHEKKVDNSIVTDDNVQTIEDANGNTLALTFDNEKDIVLVDVDGEKQELKREKSASGVWYKNEHYELIGKGDDYTLTKDGEEVFSNMEKDNMVKVKNESGDVLDLTFDNSQGIVKAYLNGGDEIVLNEEKTASGIWYKNDNYELLGKGNSYTLMKDGKVIFEHKEDTNTVQAKNDAGDVLDLTFNNDAGTVKAYLNGGDEINLKEEKAASGIWYKNDEYELSGKGDHYELKKGDEVIFKN